MTEFLTYFTSSAPAWEWTAFFVFFIGIIAYDLHAHKDHRGAIAKEDALKWSLIWIGVSIAFGFYIWFSRDLDAASKYWTAWGMEKSLALDNLAVFITIFGAFSLKGDNKQHLQMKILYWGIIGAIVFRAILLGGGGYVLALDNVMLADVHIAIVLASLYLSFKFLHKALVDDHTWGWLAVSAASMGVLVGSFYVPFELSAGYLTASVKDIFLAVFGVIILYSAWHILQELMADDDEDDEEDYANHWSSRLVRKFLKVNPSIESGKFFTAAGVTPLFLCLLVIETSDIAFAFDSMPVVIAIAQDPFIMFTSTMMAVAGLRSLYFLFLYLKSRFWALEWAVVGLLVIIAFKLFASAAGFHPPEWLSLGMVTIALLSGVIASVMFPKWDPEWVYETITEDGKVSDDEIGMLRTLLPHKKSHYTWDDVALLFRINDKVTGHHQNTPAWGRYMVATVTACLLDELSSHEPHKLSEREWRKLKAFILNDENVDDIEKKILIRLKLEADWVPADFDDFLVEHGIHVAREPIVQT